MTRDTKDAPRRKSGVDMAHRPMETAPRDGTRFRGVVGGNHIAMFWHPHFGAFVSGFRRMTAAPGYTFDGEAYVDHSPCIERPTGWVPAPDLN